MARITQIPIKIKQKQIKSKNLNMAIEDIKKDVTPISSNKKESI